MRRVLVCGGRGYKNQEELYHFLDTEHALHPFSLVIEGGARGADLLAKKWAISRGIKVNEFRAYWKKYGKAAGIKRNQTMLDDGKPDIVVAFKGGIGTADMMRRAKKAGIPVLEVSKIKEASIKSAAIKDVVDHLT